MSLARRLITGLVLVAFVVSFNSPLLEAAAGATDQQQAVHAKQKTRFLRSAKAKARGAELYATLFPAGTTLETLKARLSEARRDALTFQSEDEASLFEVRAMAPNIERLLNLARISQLSGSERQAALRQLPSARPILASRPTPTRSAIGPPQRTPELPDGSEATPARMVKADLCEDEEGWSECASDDDLLAAEIESAQLAWELASMESDLGEAEEEIEEVCSNQPELCLLYTFSPESDTMPVSFESEDGDGLSGESDGPATGPCSSPDNDYTTCVVLGVSAYLGIEGAHVLNGNYEAAAKSFVRPSKRKLFGLGARAVLGTFAASFLVVSTVYCVVEKRRQVHPTAHQPYYLRMQSLS